MREYLEQLLLVLAIGSAAAFTWIDAWYAVTNRISVIYLADAALELSLITWIVLAHLRDRRVHRETAAL